MHETQDRILDAAELLFARHGVAATSLRSITNEAGVNTAAIHYHFGSKPELVAAVVNRRLAPLQRERLEGLDKLRDQAGERPIPIDALLEAFLAPVATPSQSLADSMRTVGSLMAWLRVEGEEPLIAPAGMMDVKQRFAEELSRGRELELEEATERLEYAMGATMHFLMNRMLQGEVEDSDYLELRASLDRLLHFLAAGFEATPMLQAGASAPRLAGEMR